MTKTLRLLFPVALAVLALAHSAFAQYGGQGLGSALSSDPLSHQGQVRPGVDDIASRASQEAPFKIIKDVKLGLKDVDPNVRVSELTKLRHLQDPEVAYRDLDRELKLNNWKFAHRASSKPDADINPQLKAAIDEFTWPKGEEITQWTQESVIQQLEKIGSKYGDSVAAKLGLAMMMVYRHASEVAHGTLFGALWTAGITTGRPSSISEAEVIRMRDEHQISSMVGLLYFLNLSVSTLLKIAAKDFPSCLSLYQESDALYQELHTALGLREEEETTA